MDRRIAASLSVGGAVAFVSMWCILLFAARPDCADSYALAVEAVRYALSPAESGTWLFVYTLVSIAICIITSLVLITAQSGAKGMWLAAGHSLLGAFVYSWSIVLLLALPLLFWGRLGKGA